MADPPSTAALKSRIVADIHRAGHSLVTYTELREAWPDEFATIAQFTLLSTIAEEEKWDFEFVSVGVLFTPKIAG